MLNTMACCCLLINEVKLNTNFTLTACDCTLKSYTNNSVLSGEVFPSFQYKFVEVLFGVI